MDKLYSMEQQLELEHVRYMFIIDDDAVQREMIKDYMNERYVFEVKTYSNGEDAMNDIKSMNPEILILDFHLNSQINDAKNGIEVLKHIKQISPATEVVMFSGEDSLEVAVASLKNGAYDYVVKGESAFNQIENVINKLGERHKMEVIQTAQKRTITFLVAIIAVILLAAIIFYLKGDYVH